MGVRLCSRWGCFVFENDSRAHRRRDWGGKGNGRRAGGGSPTPERNVKGRSAAEGCTSAARNPGDTGSECLDRARGWSLSVLDCKLRDVPSRTGSERCGVGGWIEGKALTLSKGVGSEKTERDALVRNRISIGRKLGYFRSSCHRGSSQGLPNRGNWKERTAWVKRKNCKRRKRA